MIEGRIDEFKNGTLFGWAADLSRHDLKVVIAVYSGEVLLTEAPADRRRQDLVTGGVGDGAHAFEIKLDGVNDNNDLRVVARAAGEETVLSLASPDERKLEALFDLHLARVEDAIRRLRRDQQQLATSIAANEGANATGELRSDLEGLAKRMAAAEARLESYEIFVMRIDAQIKNLTEAAPRKTWLGRPRQ